MSSGFTLKKHAIGFREFQHRHLSDNINKALHNMIYIEHDVNVENNNLFEGIVLDGGADINKAAASFLHEKYHCSNHNLHLAVKSSLETPGVKRIIKKVNRFVKLERKSYRYGEMRTYILDGAYQRCLRTASVWHEQLGRSSYMLSSHGPHGMYMCSLASWLRRKMGTGKKALRKANVTRWTSVYEALNSFLGAKHAIMSVFTENEGRVKKNKIISDKVKQDDIKPTAEEWVVLSEVVGSLEQATRAAVVLQGDKYVTLSTVLPTIAAVRASVDVDMFIKTRIRYALLDSPHYLFTVSRCRQDWCRQDWAFPVACCSLASGV
jgi:hypothetical protein